MTHQPMGVSGVDTDIVTGRPAYEQRLFELAKDDPFLRGLDMQATAYNLKLNFGPVSLPGRPWFHPSLSSKLPRRTADAAPRSLLNRPADGLR